MPLLRCERCEKTWVVALREKVCPTCKREGQRVLVSEVVKHMDKKTPVKK
jgi:Zn finger protein HypA/HybF involved in hydrogenase expression